MIRDSLKILLELEEDIKVVATVSNGQEVYDYCRQEEVELILMDIRMPIMDGVLATKMIKEQFRNIKIMILTTFKDDEYIKEALKYGAEGYILKSQSSEGIIESLRMIHRGNAVFEGEVADALKTMLKENKTNKEELQQQLTERELDILKHIGEGLSNKEIAEQLYLSQGTVRNYVTGLLEKLGLRDRTQLAIYYIKNIE
nr:response regulator transcription factor [Alkaliphilus hydrothermalis]